MEGIDHWHGDQRGDEGGSGSLIFPYSHKERDCKDVTILGCGVFQVVKSFHMKTISSPGHLLEQVRIVARKLRLWEPESTHNILCFFTSLRLKIGIKEGPNPPVLNFLDT